MTQAEALTLLIDRLVAGEQIRDDDPFETAVGLERANDIIAAVTGDCIAVARFEQDLRSRRWRGLLVADRTDEFPPRWVAQWSAPTTLSGEASQETEARLIAVLKALRRHRSI